MIAVTEPVWEAITSGRYTMRNRAQIRAPGASSGWMDLSDRLQEDGISPISQSLSPGMAGYEPALASVSLRNDDRFLAPGVSGALFTDPTRAYTAPVRIQTGIEGSDGAWQWFDVFTGRVDALSLDRDVVELRASTLLAWLDRTHVSSDRPVVTVKADGAAGPPTRTAVDVIDDILDEETVFASGVTSGQQQEGLEWLNLQGWCLAGTVPKGDSVANVIRDLARSQMATAIDTEDGNLAFPSEFLPRDLGAGTNWGGEYVPIRYDNTNVLSWSIADAMQSMATAVTVDFFGGSALYADSTLEDELATLYGLSKYRIGQTVQMPYCAHHYQAAWAARIIQASSAAPRLYGLAVPAGHALMVQLNDRVTLDAPMVESAVTARVVGKQWSEDGTIMLTCQTNPAESSIFAGAFATMGSTSWGSGSVI